MTGLNPAAIGVLDRGAGHARLAARCIDILKATRPQDDPMAIALSNARAEAFNTHVAFSTSRTLFEGDQPAIAALNGQMLPAEHAVRLLYGVDEAPVEPRSSIDLMRWMTEHLEDEFFPSNAQVDAARAVLVRIAG